MIDKNITDAALHAVSLAAKLTANVRSAMVSDDTLEKKDKSPVTVADYGAQALIISMLSSQFPELPFVAEEDSGELALPANKALLENVHSHVAAINGSMNTSAVIEAISKGNYEGKGDKPFWTLDPIDGTKGFLRNEQYAIALSLISGGKPVFGVLGCPNLYGYPDNSHTGLIFHAQEGHGAFVRKVGDASDLSIKASSSSDLKSAAICESVESGHTKHDQASEIASLLGINGAPVRIDSQCKYAAVARGEASIYLRLPTRPGYEEKIWDHAAGMIVAQEAGAVVTDTLGKPLDFSLGRTLANNKGVVVVSEPISNDVIKGVIQVLQSNTSQT